MRCEGETPFVLSLLSLSKHEGHAAPRCGRVWFDTPLARLLTTNGVWKGGR